MKTTIDREKLISSLWALRAANPGGHAERGLGLLVPVRLDGVDYAPETARTTYAAPAIASALFSVLSDQDRIPRRADKTPLGRKFFAEWMGMSASTSEAPGPVAAALRAELGERVPLDGLRRGDLVALRWKDECWTTPPRESAWHLALVWDAAFDRAGKTQAVQLKATV